MDNGIRISAAGMTNRSIENEFTAHNTANMDNDYYKAKEVFYVNTDGDTPEAVTNVNLEAGSLKETKNSLDVVLGERYFLKTADTDGNISYIKDGKLKVDSEGDLSYNDNKVLDTKGESIKVLNPSDFTIMKNGDVIQNSVVTNTLAIVEADKNAEIKAGVNNQYTIDADGLKTPAGYNLITQGFRENSNVNRANEMIKMINGMHAYESNQKSIIANDEEISRTINELGKF